MEKVMDTVTTGRPDQSRAENLVEVEDAKNDAP